MLSTLCPRLLRLALVTIAFALPVNALADAARKAPGLTVSQPQVYRAEVVSSSTAVKTPRLDATPVQRAWRPGDPIRFVPKRVYPIAPLGAPANPTTWTVDPLLEIQAEAEAKTAPNRNFATQDVNVAGIGFNGSFPPDTVGDVGPNHYVQALNGPGGTSVQVFNKSGGTIGGILTLSSLGGGICATGAGDPIILYDRLADRWMLSEFSGAGNALCVYISQTPDPTGTYFAYQFNTPNFPDYPKYGVWPDAYYVGTNEGAGSPVYAMNRTAMLTGAASTIQRFVAPDLAGFGFQVLQPADLDGATPPPAGTDGIYMRHRDDERHNPGANNPTQDFLEIWELNVDFVTPANSSLTGPTNIAMSEIDSELCGFFSFMCFPQPGTAQTLDPLREPVMHRLQYRNFGAYQTLVGNLTTDVSGTDRGGIRWFELRNSGGGWTLFQEGTYSPDTDSRWMGSIAMSGDGDIAVGYSVSSTTTFPSIRYTGRLASDPAGSMPQGEHSIGAGGGSQTAAERWGDYSAMSVDPADDCSFWFTTEYVPSGSNWQTRIAKFNFPGCGGPPPVCGNGVIETGEVCDDGNMNSGDGCSDICAVESGFTCTGEPSVCTPVVSNDCLNEDYEDGLAGWTTFNTGALNLDWGTTDDGFCGSVNWTAGNYTGGAGVAACVDSDAAGNGQVESYLCSPQFYTGDTDAFLSVLANYQVFGAADPDDFFQVLFGTAAPSPATIGSYIPLYDDSANLGVLEGTGATISGPLAGLEGLNAHVCFGYGADFDWYGQVDDVVWTASSGCGAPPVNNPPELAPIGDQFFLIPAMFSVPLSATDQDGDELTFTADVPPFCTLVDGGPGDDTAVINCNATTPDQAIAQSVLVTVTDDGTPPLNDQDIFTLVLDFDEDLDGIRDLDDNCIDVPNPDQLDGDSDGFGNLCDGDFNQDCIVNAIDLGFFKSVFFTSNGSADFNGDGIVNAVDLGLFKTRFFVTPGPSSNSSCD